MTKVRSVAEKAFPATYSDILSERQLDYMMEWMYSAENLARQLEEGHIFYIAYDGKTLLIDQGDGKYKTLQIDKARLDQVTTTQASTQKHESTSKKK